MPQKNRRSVWDGWLIAFVLVLGVAYAVFASGDLWLDEILSLQWAKNATAVTDLVAVFKHDNNHPLNTLWIYAVGMHRDALTYRLPALLAGLLSFILLSRLLERLCPGARWPVLLWAGLSYAFALYFSEARGYAVAIAAVLAAFWMLLEKRRASPWTAWMPAFWAVCVAGILSHATVIFPIAAMAVWVAWDGRTPERWRACLVELLAWFGIPFGVFAGFYFGFLREMMVAGGPVHSPLRVASDYFAYGLGLPALEVWNLPAAIFGGFLLISAAVFARLPTAGLRLFFVFAIAVFPLLGAAVSGTGVVYFRYFLVTLPFVFLLCGCLFERAIAYGRAARILLWLVPVLASFVQIPRLASLAAHGRGEYRAALARVVADPSVEPTLRSDHDMLVGMVAEYHRSRVPAFTPIRYLPNWAEGPKACNWVVFHHQADTPPRPEPTVVVEGKTFVLERHFACAPVSGSHWFLYRLLRPQ